MEQIEQKAATKEEVLAVLEQLMSEIGGMDKLDMPDEESSESKDEKDQEMSLGEPDMESEVSEGKPDVVVAIGKDEEGAPKEEDDMTSYLKSKMKGQMYK